MKKNNRDEIVKQLDYMVASINEDPLLSKEGKIKETFGKLTEILLKLREKGEFYAISTKAKPTDNNSVIGVKLTDIIKTSIGPLCDTTVIVTWFKISINTNDISEFSSLDRYRDECLSKVNSTSYEPVLVGFVVDNPE